MSLYLHILSNKEHLSKAANQEMANYQSGQTLSLSSVTRQNVRVRRSHNYNLRQTTQRNQAALRLQNKKTQSHVLGNRGDMFELEMAGNTSPNTSWDSSPSPDNSFYNESQYQVGDHGTQMGMSLGRSGNFGEILDLVNRQHPFSSTRRQSISPSSTLTDFHNHSHSSNERSHDYLQRSYSHSVFDCSTSDGRSTHSSIDPSLLALEAPVLVYNGPSNSMSAGTEVRSLRPRR